MGQRSQCCWERNHDVLVAQGPWIREIRDDFGRSDGAVLLRFFISLCVFEAESDDATKCVGFD